MRVAREAREQRACGKGKKRKRSDGRDTGEEVSRDEKRTRAAEAGGNMKVRVLERKTRACGGRKKGESKRKAQSNGKGGEREGGRCEEDGERTSLLQGRMQEKGQGEKRGEGSAQLAERRQGGKTWNGNRGVGNGSNGAGKGGEWQATGAGSGKSPNEALVG